MVGLLNNVAVEHVLQVLQWRECTPAELYDPAVLPLYCSLRLMSLVIRMYTVHTLGSNLSEATHRETSRGRCVHCSVSLPVACMMECAWGLERVVFIHPICLMQPLNVRVRI